MAKWRIRVACCIFKATNPHSEYVILIAFPIQQRLQERASVLRLTYVAFSCLIIYFHHIKLIVRWWDVHRDWFS